SPPPLPTRRSSDLGGAGGNEQLRQVAAEEALQLLYAVYDRQHDAAGALPAKPGGAQLDDLVVQLRAQIVLDARGVAVGQQVQGMLESAAQQDGDGGCGQR